MNQQNVKKKKKNSVKYILLALNIRRKSLEKEFKVPAR